METMQLLGDNCSNGTTAFAAGAGALIGSWFGNGWNGGGWGGRGNGDLGSAAVGYVAGKDSSVDPILMDAVTANGAAINSQTIANLQGFAGLNSTVLSSMAGHQNAVNQGFAGLNTTVMAGDMDLQNSVNQGFAGLNTAVVGQGYESRLASADIAREIAACCCKQTAAIAAEGAATRQLIQDNFINDLQTKLCDEKANNIALKQEVALQASQSAQTREIIATVLAHVK